jgi:hypothetical protein
LFRHWDKQDIDQLTPLAVGVHGRPDKY